VAEVRRLLLDHLQDHYALYGDSPACAARASTLAGMCERLPGGEAFRQRINRWRMRAQWQRRGRFFDELASVHGPHARPAAGRAWADAE
jgi:tRNA-dihydrouridine synthase B